MFTNIERKYFLHKGKKYLYEICFNENDWKFWLAFMTDFSSFENIENLEKYLKNEGSKIVEEYLSYDPNFDSDWAWFLPSDDEERETMYLEKWESLKEKEQEEIKKILSKQKAKKPKKAISLRLDENDILTMKKLAKEQWMPYQTLISSIIHKVATNQIKI